MDQIIECPKCDGYGATEMEEDGRIVTHACYACGNTGRITPEQRDANRLTDATYRISEAMFAEYGTGWREGASEDGVDLHEAAFNIRDGLFHEAGKALDGLPENVRKAIVALLAPLPAQTPPAPQAAAHESVTRINMAVECLPYEPPVDPLENWDDADIPF